ncbi:hypothetical protein BO71DRAFT_438270 [Aspergillus ellipticus CBS 707.79]|uniref:RNA recognition motif-containing protein n=1 Tax=Aspergillus ellipticus CBS 707.79 TaxID=1448320 RepID=A0A319DKX8_9EURO|nr:hypothetical protein BO71DRAFT_438270 [Aspergillus ellipticus CBS 707.79]
MPPLPGEERILTVFADIHYYFAAPTPRPLHHRFDKGSYLYVYHNVVHHKIRVEVANNPGAPEQDAFNGALDNVHLRHSTGFPTLCTVTVDGQVPSQPQAQLAFPPPPGAISQEWKLAHTDPLNLVPLHTLDIYFWTTEDANQFLDLLESHLPQSQIETDRHPYPPPPQSTVSSVVQQLETVAITDPGYQNGQTRNSQAEVVPNPIPSYQAITPPSNLPPPPPLGAPPTAMQPIVPSIQSVANEQQQVTPSPPPPPAPAAAPLPYNPAAPAAPEPIQHREKTPPPDDGENGTGLATAAVVDHVITIPSSSQIPPGPPTGGLPSPPPGPPPYSMPGSYGSPPPSAGLSSFNTSFQSPPSYTPSFLTGDNTGSILSAGGQHPVNPMGPPHAQQLQQQQQQQQQHQGSMPMSFAPPPPGPNAHLFGQLSYPPRSDSESPTAMPLVTQLGGYSNYSYEQAPKRHASVSGGEFGIHNQLYRPTEAEATSRHQKYAREAMQKPGERPQTFVKAAYKVEGGVNRFLRKLEKRL